MKKSATLVSWRSKKLTFFSCGTGAACLRCGDGCGLDDTADEDGDDCGLAGGWISLITDDFFNDWAVILDVVEVTDANGSEESFCTFCNCWVSNSRAEGSEKVKAGICGNVVVKGGRSKDSAAVSSAAFADILAMSKELLKNEICFWPTSVNPSSSTFISWILWLTAEEVSK